MVNVNVLGVFATRLSVEHAALRLRADGFRNTDLSVLYRPSSLPDAVGATFPPTLAWIAGIGVIMLPGAGYFVAGGPLSAALVIRRAVSGQQIIINALTQFNVPAPEAARYAGRATKDGILLLVSCDQDTWAERAMRIMMDCSGDDIASSAGMALKEQLVHEPISQGR